MTNKQILDYREPFNAPYMIREIAKNVHLPFIVYAQDFTIAILSFLVLFLLLIPAFGFNQLTAFLSLGIPYGLVQLFNKVEPDGKRLDLFTKDYFTYLWQFQLPKKQLYHEQIQRFHFEPVVYDKKTVGAIRVFLE